MPSKENICYRILKRYGFLILYSGRALDKVPKPKKKETLGQWKKRVLGSNVQEVALYTPIQPPPQTQVKTLQEQSGGPHIAKIFEAYGRFKDRTQNEAVTATEQELFEQFSTIPKETLRSIVNSFKGELEPSVSEFFERYLSSQSEDIDTAGLLEPLVKTYNNVVRRYRQLEANRSLQPTARENL